MMILRVQHWLTDSKVMVDAISIVIHWIVCWQEKLSPNAILNLGSGNVLGIVSLDIGKSFGHTS